MNNSVAIVIPALNEEATVGDVIRRCFEALKQETVRTTVFLIDDGSTDNTASVAREAGATVIQHATNMGVGRAFQTGLVHALRSGADIIVNIDADGQFDPANIPALIEPIKAGRADFATASRFKDADLVPKMPSVKLWGNRMMSHLISRIAGKKFYDVSCGFRAYNRDAALRLNLWGHFTYTQESILDLVVKGMRIEEVPLSIQGVRSTGKSRVASNLWRYGTRSLKIILHSYRDYWPMHFFGWLSVPFFTLGFGLVGFLAIHRLTAGSFSPHIWAGFTGAALLAVGGTILLVGVAADMLKRIRLNQEMLLFYHRKEDYDIPDDD
jgi:glycosyltransferase involved in cell wall biosynthesis